MVAIAATTEKDPISAPLDHHYTCEYCHMIPGSELPAASNVSIRCTGCHRDISDDDLHKVNGKPEACLTCHQMHAQTEHLLTSPAEVLCQNCHRDQGSKLLAKEHATLTSGADAGSCQTCHVVHPERHQRLLSDDPIKICRQCHNLGESIYNHPVGAPLIDIHTGSELTCTSSCHDAHGTDNTHLLRLEDSDGLCTSCHQIFTLS